MIKELDKYANDYIQLIIELDLYLEEFNKKKEALEESLPYLKHHPLADKTAYRVIRRGVESSLHDLILAHFDWLAQFEDEVKKIEEKKQRYLIEHLTSKLASENENKAETPSNHH